MGKSKIKEPESLDVPIVPLIDIGFELIIFFVLTAATTGDIVDEEVSLAEAKYVAPVQKNDPQSVTINMHQDGSINIVKQKVTLRELGQILRAARKQYGNSIPIILRCDGKTVYRDVDRVMEVIGKSGLYRVQISAVVK